MAGDISEGEAGSDVAVSDVPNGGAASDDPGARNEKRPAKAGRSRHCPTGSMPVGSSGTCYSNVIAEAVSSISTRRFIWRPAAVSLVAIGSFSPRPSVVMFASG